MKATVKETVKAALKQNHQINHDKFDEVIMASLAIAEVNNPPIIYQQSVFINLLINFLLSDPTVPYLNTGNYCQDTRLLLGFNFEQNGDFFKVSLHNENDNWYFKVINQGFTHFIDFQHILYLIGSDEKKIFVDVDIRNGKIKAFLNILFRFAIDLHKKI